MGGAIVNAFHCGECSAVEAAPRRRCSVSCIVRPQPPHIDSRFSTLKCDCRGSWLHPRHVQVVLARLHTDCTSTSALRTLFSTLERPREVLSERHVGGEAAAKLGHAVALGEVVGGLRAARAETVRLWPELRVLEVVQELVEDLPLLLELLLGRGVKWNRGAPRENLGPRGNAGAGQRQERAASARKAPGKRQERAFGGAPGFGRCSVWEGVGRRWLVTCSETKCEWSPTRASSSRRS